MERQGFFASLVTCIASMFSRTPSQHFAFSHRVTDLNFTERGWWHELEIHYSSATGQVIEEYTVYAEVNGPSPWTDGKVVGHRCFACDPSEDGRRDHIDDWMVQVVWGDDGPSDDGPGEPR